MTCDTCDRAISVDEANGIQCLYCYDASGPRLTLQEWHQDGCEPPRFCRIRLGDPR